MGSPFAEGNCEFVLVGAGGRSADDSGVEKSVWFVGAVGLGILGWFVLVGLVLLGWLYLVRLVFGWFPGWLVLGWRLVLVLGFSLWFPVRLIIFLLAILLGGLPPKLRTRLGTLFSTLLCSSSGRTIPDLLNLSSSLLLLQSLLGQLLIAVRSRSGIASLSTAYAVIVE